MGQKLVVTLGFEGSRTCPEDGRQKRVEYKETGREGDRKRERFKSSIWHFFLLGKQKYVQF